MTTTHPPEATIGPGQRHRWLDRAGYLTAAWAGLYGVLALVWTLTGRGYPFGANNTNGELNLLRLLPTDVGAPAFAGFALLTAVAALAMSGTQAVRLRGLPRGLLAAYGWLSAALLVLVVPDVKVLALTGYAPMLILGAPFGWPPIDTNVFTWSLFNQLFCAVGGVLVAGTVLTWQLRTAGLCVSCGRGPRVTWTSAASAVRWGRWAAYVAATVPVIYALTRFAWLAGIPLGLSEQTLHELQDSNAVWAGFGLGAFAVVGAILTLGLVQRWGEAFPRWMLGLAGRRVPISLAVVPATYVALAVAAASIGFFGSPRFLGMMGELNAAAAPMMLWPVWALALGAATLAYYLRRRGRCARCLRTD